MGTTLDFKRALALLERQLWQGKHALAHRTFLVLGQEVHGDPKTGERVLEILRKVPNSRFLEHLVALARMQGVGAAAPDFEGGSEQLEVLADQGELYSILLLAMQAVLGQERDPAQCARHRERLAPLVRERHRLSKALYTCLTPGDDLMGRLMLEPSPSLTVQRQFVASQKAAEILDSHVERESQALRTLRRSLAKRPTSESRKGAT